MADKCKECGCMCGQCLKNDENHAEMHLHVEIEHLRQRLLERDSHIVTMETQFLNEADKFPNGELASIKEEMLTWQEKYSRLYEAHKRVQKVNQNLEDKLLRIVDKCETEKSAFTKDIATLSHRLADANYTIHKLTQDNEKYRNDVNLAIQLLQCKPSNFVSQRYDSLPSEVQAKVRTYVAQKRIVSSSDNVSAPDVKSITVPISTFPPTAMVYNITKPNNVEKDSDEDSDDSKPPVDIVSAAIMAKVLEERERERVFAKHCDTCTCHRSILTNEVETQTDNFLSNYKNGDKFTDNNTSSSNSTTGFQNHTQSTNNKNNDEWTDLNVNRSTSFQYVNERPFVSNNISFKSSSNLKTNTDNTTKSNNKNGNYTLISDGLHQQQQHRDTPKLINQSPIKQATFNQNNALDKTSRQSIARMAKKSDPQSVYRLSKSIGQSAKYKPLPSNDLDFIDRKPQRQVDVINDRIWKNDWSISSQKSNSNKQTDALQSGEQTIDVINDRTWKSVENSTTKPRLTLIEVKPLVVDNSVTNLNQQNDSRLHQSEDTASPSFSSDSLVISSSDPPSTSSDAVSQLGGNNRSVSNKTSPNNNVNSSLMSNWQDRTTGPRGCSMRITPGSKNILLDNAGNYQTVLYTSTAGGRPNTALVHTAKSNKSGGSASTSSTEENSPTAVLPTDNSQLQRVAEWVKASGPIERQTNNKSKDDMSIKTLNNALSKIKDGKMTVGTADKKSNSNLKIGNSLNGKQPQTLVLDEGKKMTRLSRDLRTPNSLLGIKDENEDLISFDSPVDEERGDHQFEFNSRGGETTADVKVTKEMEETYLKLAASLDPDNLELSSSESNDITIEKYRKEFKRTHIIKQLDKTNGSTS